MEKEFIPYEQALALKELGFDEPCFGYYLCKNSAFGIYIEITSNWLDLLPYDSSSCKAPLYQQAFRWFVKMYDLHITIHTDKWCEISKNGLVLKDTHSFDTNEEAELECLKKLIEIVKNK